MALLALLPNAPLLRTARLSSAATAIAAIQRFKVALRESSSSSSSSSSSNNSSSNSGAAVADPALLNAYWRHITTRLRSAAAAADGGCSNPMTRMRVLGHRVTSRGAHFWLPQRSALRSVRRATHSGPGLGVCHVSPLFTEAFILCAALCGLSGLLAWQSSQPARQRNCIQPAQPQGQQCPPLPPPQ